MPEAIASAKEAVELAEKLRLPNVSYLSATILGRTYHAIKEYDLAYKALSEAINQIELMRSRVAGGEQEQQLFFEDKVGAYHLMIDLLMQQGRTAEALDYAERAKGRVVLDVLLNGRVDLTKAITPAQQQEEEKRLNQELVSLSAGVQREENRRQRDEKRLTELRNSLSRARSDYELFQTKIYNNLPEVKSKRGQFSPFKVEDAAQLIRDSRTALLEYVVTENTTYLFVLTK